MSQNALDLDGSNDYVQTTFPGISGTAARTVEAWIKTTANANPNAGGVQQIITDWGVFATGSRFTFCVLWNNAIRVELSGGGLSGTIAVNDGLWHHVAVVYNPLFAGNPYSLYVDGVLDNTGQITTPINTSSGNMRIGQRMDGARHFDGSIDEVRVWNFAKTQAQIQNTMNGELCGSQTGLMAYYTCNEGIAGGNNLGISNLPDLSGNGYQGTLTNMALNGANSNWVSGAPISPGASHITFNALSCSPSYTSPSGTQIWTSSGTYQDTIPGTNGCDSTFTVNLNIQSVMADFSVNGPANLCLGDSVPFVNSSTGGTAFTWFANMIPFAQASTAGYTFSDTGMVEILLVVNNGPCTDSSRMMFSVSGPILGNPMITDESCTGEMDGGIDIEVVGGSIPFHYVWTTGDTTQDLTQLSAGTYSLIVTDGQGCSITDSFVVNSTLAVHANFSASADPSVCPGESISFTNTSQMASAYEWRENGITFAQSMNTSFVFPDSGQVLIELLASEGNCSDSVSQLFTVNAAPKINAIIMGESCPESQDGSIDLNLIGGSSPFSFLWSNSETSEDLTGLESGSYELTMTDSANCIIIDTFLIETLGGVQAAFSNQAVAQGMLFIDESLGDSTITSWHWEFGTGLAEDTSNVQNPVFDYGISGTFQVCLSVQDLFGCTDSICQFVSYAVGIDPALYREIQIFPNPSQGIFSIELGTLSHDMILIEVFDGQGKLVHMSNHSGEAGIRFDLSDLAKGLYHLRARDKKSWFRARFLIE